MYKSAYNQNHSTVIIFLYRMIIHPKTQQFQGMQDLYQKLGLIVFMQRLRQVLLSPA
jgi:hypothetical protein